MRFSELEFSVKQLRSSAVFGGRPERPLICRIRSAHRRERGHTLSETSEKCAFFGIVSGIRPSYSWILAHVEFERINNGEHFQIGVISKLTSKFLPDDAFFMAASKRLPDRSYFCCVSFPFGSVGMVLYNQRRMCREYDSLPDHIWN